MCGYWGVGNLMKDFDVENYVLECIIVINCCCNIGFYFKIDIYKVEENIGSY